MKKEMSEEECAQALRALIYLTGGTPPRDAHIEELEALLRKEMRCNVERERLSMLKDCDFRELLAYHGLFEDFDETTFSEVKKIWEEIKAQD